MSEIVLRHRLDGQEVNNVLNFFTNAVPTPALVTSMANAASEAWTGDIMPLLSVALTFVSADVRSLHVADGPQASTAPVATVVGGVGGDCLPASVAFCMTHRTGLAGRSRRGRTFFSGLPEFDVTLNTISAAKATALTNGFASFIADLDLLGAVLVVVSRYTNKLPRATGISTAVTSSQFRDRRVDSQRGRMP